jgi:hypothetical protein
MNHAAAKTMQALAEHAIRNASASPELASVLMSAFLSAFRNKEGEAIKLFGRNAGYFAPEQRGYDFFR